LARARRAAPYYAYRCASLFARALPETLGQAASEHVGVVAGRLARGRRANMAANLARVRGAGLRGPALEAALDRAFASYGRYWLETFRLPDRTPAELAAGMRCEGLENLAAAAAGGRGVVLAIPHLGGWEWGGAWLASIGLPMTVVVEVIEPPALFAWFSALRTRLGLRVVPLGPAAGAEMLRSLRAGEIVGLLGDRDLSGNGVPVEFFGAMTTLPVGPATLALRTGAPLLVCAVYFEGSGHGGFISAPLDTSRHAAIHEDVRRVTQELAHVFERLVRRAPEQWHVFQPNWPSDPGR